MLPKFKRYASTNARLLSHFDRLREIGEEKFIRPITVEISPTDKCNLNCSWCSVRDRAGRELSLEQVKDVINDYATWGAKSFEFTGGGDPLMHPDIEEIVEYAHDKIGGEKFVGGVGLITNGIGLAKIKNLAEFTEKLTWMRISLSGLDFGAEKQYYKINPDDIKTFMGCSYLVTESDDHKFYHIKEDLKGKVLKAATHLRAKYVRVIPNCNDTRQIQWLKRYGSSLIHGLPNFFVQAKDFWVPKTCYWRYMKPFVNSDGFIYQCSTCSLFERRFPKAWQFATVDTIDELYLDPHPTSFDTSGCKLCFFNHQNQAIEDLLTEVVHKEFV
jgi:MoaA/NifB/PqqE/SkfB family radical SAM enzyme